MASTQKKGTNPAFVGTASMNAETISSTVNSKLTAVKLSSSFAQKSINAGLADSKSAPFVASTTTTALLGNEEYQSHALQNLNIGAVSTAGTGQEASISESLVMTIRVVNGVNIRGAKGEHVNSFIRTQFADFDYKDTATIVDNGNPDYNLSYEHVFNVDETLIETFANKLITLTLIESLPKEKTALLGSAEVSLYKPFLQYYDRNIENDGVIPEAPLQFRKTVQIDYLNPKLLLTSPEASKLVSECTIEISLSRPLLTSYDISHGNFVKLRIDDVYPIPDEWTTKEGSEKDLNSNVFSYTINLTLPSDQSKERVISISNGSLVLCEAPVVSDPIANVPRTVTLADIRKEHTAQATLASAAGVSSSQPLEEADSDPVEIKETKRVFWGQSSIVYLSPTVLEQIRKQATDKKPLEIEFIRTPMTKFTSVTDTLASKYRGRATIDMSMLMYPNIIGIKGRFPLDVVDTSDSSAQAASFNEIPAQFKGNKKLDQNNVYRNIGSAVSMEFMLSKPLIDKKKLQASTKSVSDFIPKRYIPEDLQFKKRSNQADEDYRTKINEIVHKLVDKYRDTLQKEVELQSEEMNDHESRSAESQQQRKKLFMYHLNKSGAYFSLKEQLKASVVQVIRERFLQKSPFLSVAEQQLFMSNVYVYLIDQMHVAINQIFSKREPKFVDPAMDRLADFHSLKEFADVAEFNGKYSISARYHLERVAKYEDTISAWFDYGCFMMRTNSLEKGEACFKEILSRNSKYVPALLVYGAICCAHEKLDEAHVYMTSAVKLEPKCILSNVFMGILLDILGDDAESEKYIAEAKLLHGLQHESVEDGPTPYLEAAIFATSVHLGDFSDRALSQELLLRGATVKPYLLLSQLKIQSGHYDKALEHLKEALALDSNNVTVWTELGHLMYIQGKYTEAKHAYETVLSFNPDEKKMAPIYIRLGTIYLHNAYLEVPVASEYPDALTNHLQFLKHREECVDVSLASIAKNMFLKACSTTPSSQSWHGAGKACFALKEYQETEDAFAEANVLNNRDSEVWANIALLSLTLGRITEAHQAITQALYLGIKDADILKAVGVAFLREKQAMAAVECLRMALEGNPEDMGTRELFLQAMGESSKAYFTTAKDSNAIDISKSVYNLDTENCDYRTIPRKDSIGIVHNACII
ncbi:hypothetical protein QVD99_006319 [Batrachochytrium dendrobatidis]|nr:hypothetical protein O5D80_003335 [Batrachochytrium dendrobatidis]KAK5667106.1 hypothetical protein QVD99_006319 [Batrachochytrium dendrobatidis]